MGTERREGISFRFEIEVVGGEEGRQLRLEQARATQDLLSWVRDQRRSHNMYDHSARRPKNSR